MQTLLPKIRARLQGLPWLKRRQDVYVTPYENFMPTGTRPPCLGIVPGPVTRRELAGEMVERQLTVRLAAYVPLTGDGEGVLCDAGTGVYPLLDGACALLTGSGLDVPGLQLVRIGGDRGSELFQTDNKTWLVKVVRDVLCTVETPAL